MIERVGIIIHDQNPRTDTNAVADLDGCLTFQSATTDAYLISNDDFCGWPRGGDHHRLNGSNGIRKNAASGDKIIAKFHGASRTLINHGKPIKLTAHPAFHTEVLDPPRLKGKPDEPIAEVAEFSVDQQQILPPQLMIK